MEKVVRGGGLLYISIVLDCPGRLSRSSMIIWKNIKGGVNKNIEGDMICDVISPLSNRNLKGWQMSKDNDVQIFLVTPKTFLNEIY